MILLVLSTLILLYLWHYRKFYIYASKLPSVEGGLPIVGFAHLLLGKNNEEIYIEMNKITSSPGPSPRSFWLGPMFMIIIDDPMQLQNVLNSPKCIDKPSLYEGLGMKKGN
ncbi:CLUMA_CG012755, isoform A [Clunio marinus]|uniref:CLUMA_CG012755, isoform A n=1 Tax=Clunio marinus TaxID=568069 RepID=A0A1J1IHK0_9DIPT|nr:CLUMA_CG012755, isoform A [Clunio marinus]